MKKAKSAIDKLAELPPFDPVAGPSSAVNVADVAPVDLGGQSESSRYEIGQFHHQQGAAGNPMSFHGYPHQDLCLSLQSFQNPGLDPGNPNSSHALFPTGFEAGPSGGGGGGEHWAPPETNLGEMGHFSRLLAWSGAAGGSGGGVGLGYGAGDRGTLQSNFNPPQSIRAWDDLSMGTTSDDHRIPKAEIQGGLMHHHHQQQQPMAAPGIGILGSGGFMGYCVPAQMQGGGEDVHSITVAYHQNSASSMSTDSSR